MYSACETFIVSVGGRPLKFRQLGLLGRQSPPKRRQAIVSIPNSGFSFSFSPIMRPALVNGMGSSIGKSLNFSSFPLPVSLALEHSMNCARKLFSISNLSYFIFVGTKIGTRRKLPSKTKDRRFEKFAPLFAGELSVVFTCFH